MLTDLRYALGQLRKAQAYASAMRRARPVKLEDELASGLCIFDCLERAADGLERCIDEVQAAEDAALNDDLELAECWEDANAWAPQEILRNEG